MEARFPPDSLSAREVKALLPRTWTPFFMKFGRFTAVQEAAIPVVMGGFNLFLSSKTASGKTEA
ncbi:hypothetical protein JW905_12250, partial [bacterium]|nr:hypothetical protein [candidate division CSSED10-310 bacterium]